MKESESDICGLKESRSTVEEDETWALTHDIQHLLTLDYNNLYFIIELKHLFDMITSNSEVPSKENTHSLTKLQCIVIS